MIPANCLPNRRNFLKLSAALTAGVAGLTSFAASEVAAQDDNAWIIGPKPGFSPEVGTLVSMMAFTTMQVLHNTNGMSQQDLDFLIDGKANTIGALLLHLAATDAYYHLNSFQGIAWGKFPDAAKQKWDVPMNLGEPARKAIKGNNLSYYLNALNKSREKTLADLQNLTHTYLPS